MEYFPFSSPLLAENGIGSMNIFIAMGDHGLGGWTGTGEALDGFPVSVDRGVSTRPASYFSPGSDRMVVYADNSGYIHMVNHNGIEQTGWPVFAGQRTVTGISVVNLDDDQVPEIAFGTADGRVHLLDHGGRPVPGWPVQLPARLQWQPSQLSLGGNSGRGLVCALVSMKMYLLSADGTVLPGWPINTGYSTSCIPVTADVDADGLGDILFSTYNERAYAVSSSGRGIEGWPFFLDARTSRGAMAIGHLDPDTRGLQVAVSTVDGGVVLVNGNGTIAGTWRWPNFTAGTPTSPIIARTRSGSGVIAACDSGYVYAWNADGFPIEGFPVDFGQPVSRTPAAGDIDGDGDQELVVLGRSGRMAAYRISTISTSVGCWPQMLCDEWNSGSYGVSYLPVTVVGRIASGASEGVEVTYEVTGRNVTGISLAYSTDAGYSWEETASFRDDGGRIIWFSDEDLPGADIRECALKITPYCPDGPGVSGISNIFHLDNNRPPTLFLSTLEEESDGWYLVRYAVEDPEGDVIQIQAQYSLDGGRAWRNARLTGSTFGIPPWFYGEPVRWNIGSGLEMGDVDDVILRVRAADADPGPWSEVSLREGLDRQPLTQIIVPSEEVSGSVKLGVRLSDPSMDPLDLAWQYATDSDSIWREAAISESSVPAAGNYNYEMIWESTADIPGRDLQEVRFRVAPDDAGSISSVASSPFHVDNNVPPTLDIISPGKWEHFRGSVPITFDVSDREGDSVSMLLEYRILETSSWVPARGLVLTGFFPHSTTSSRVVWNSAEDLPGIQPLEMMIRLGATDGDTVFSEPVGPLSINNSRVPSVMQAAVSSVLHDRGLVTVAYELSDPEGRNLDLLVTYSTDDGMTWKEASATGDLADMRSDGYQGYLEWNFDSDIGRSQGQVLLKLTPRADNVMGNPKILKLALN
ncbi:MAG: hypothetical protein R6U39_06600 [Candidatus Aegiribacteria sp.]